MFPTGSVYRSVSALLEANARALLGDIEGCAHAAAETLTIGRAHGMSALAQGLAVQARLDAMSGAWTAAAAAIDEAIAIAEEQWFDERPAFGVVYATASLVHARNGRRDRARETRFVAIPLVRRLDDVTPFLASLALIEIAESALLTDDVGEATELLGDAERRLRRLRDTGMLPLARERVGAAISRASARRSPVFVERLSPAEMRVLAYLPTHLSFGEIGEELFVSRNTVKSHAMAIYRKLGVTSRSAAVKGAGELGILP
jgi:LuxR family maltose regulon positive regulatory protein